MAISTKLELRQSQSLVMTPQLQQAIKLLQLSNLDLSAFVEAELEKNPLLERPEAPEENESERRETEERESANGQGGDEEWLDLGRDTAQPATAEGLDTDFGNVFPDEQKVESGPPLDSGWASLRTASRGGDGEDPNLEAYVAEERGLHEHLLEQLHLAVADPAMRLIGQHLIDCVDEAGYMRGDLDGIAERLGAPLALVEATLRAVQAFDPSGIGARDLAECLAIQLRERDRYDPLMANMIGHLDLLARHDFPGLKRACQADDEDIRDMIEEIRRLDPKPGLRFGSTAVQPVTPDVIVRPRADGAWIVELNTENLPRVLVNQSYYATVCKGAVSKQDKTYLLECLNTANWLVKSLDQRARTILKVAEEIVRQQDGFLTHGVQHLRPLNLKTVADAISMHESTVSRVTANKYMATPRGILELKYFFTSAIASASDGEAHSSEAVRHRIKQMIDAEPADDVLSDDRIVERLKADGVDIARRTVAKYREALRIPSSVQRRREKRSLGVPAVPPPPLSV